VVRLLRRSGMEASFESPDSKSVYYTKGEYSGSLWKMLLSRGEESQELLSVNFATGRVKTVSPLSHLHLRGSLFGPTAGFSCSHNLTKLVAT
jgi:hypothetical protein